MVTNEELARQKLGVSSRIGSTQTDKINSKEVKIWAKKKVPDEPPNYNYNYDYMAMMKASLGIKQKDLVSKWNKTNGL